MVDRAQQQLDVEDGLPLTPLTVLGAMELLFRVYDVAVGHKSVLIIEKLVSGFVPYGVEEKGEPHALVVEGGRVDNLCLGYFV